jgi:hypothetical protein
MILKRNLKKIGITKNRLLRDSLVERFSGAYSSLFLFGLPLGPRGFGFSAHPFDVSVPSGGARFTKPCQTVLTVAKSAAGSARLGCRSDLATQ